MDIHGELAQLINVHGLIVFAFCFPDKPPLVTFEYDIKLRLRILK
ncbi:hypothetical protein CBM2629_A60165 [Cupriavidus taiwanensis]|nr:hypothetical protein CBM2629_A60165 [Cupriavidus taiwanensis]